MQLLLWKGARFQPKKYCSTFHRLRGNTTPPAGVELSSKRIANQFTCSCRGSRTAAVSEEKDLRTVIRWIRVFIVAVGLLVGARLVLGQDKGKPSGSYALVDIDEAFSVVLARISAAKTDFLRRRMVLFDERYDFRDDHEPDVATSRGKPIQRGVRAKLAQRITWNQLAG